MSGSKFMVVKLKEVLKTALFAVLGVILIIALIHFFLSDKSDAKSAYVPGTYTSEIALDDGSVSVEVTVGEDKITSVEVINTSETVPVFYPLIDAQAQEIAQKVIEAQSTDIEVSSEAPITSQMILNAVNESLQKAAQTA